MSALTPAQQLTTTPIPSETSIQAISNAQLRTKYPAIAYTTRLLEVEPGWKIAYVDTGNRDGIPVVFVHGGPGAKFYDRDLQWFNPDKYRIIAFDQRGTGRSDPSPLTSPLAAAAYSDINIDTFVSDMEMLRKHLNIDRWLIFGGSWGSTLSLYYGQENPLNTLGLILRGIYLATQKENERFYSADHLKAEMGDRWEARSLGAMYEYAEENGIITDGTPKSLLDAFYELVIVRNDYTAMHLWTLYEEYVDQPTPEKLTEMLTFPHPEEEQDGGIASHAIFEILFFRSLPDTLNLLDPHRLEKLSQIPVVHIVQGDRDTVCPKEMAMELEEKIKNFGGNVHLNIIEGGAHSPHSPAMTDALVTITDEFITKN